MNDDDTPIWSEITGELGCPSLSGLPAVTPRDPLADPIDFCGPATCDDIPDYALAIAERLLVDLAARSALYDTAREIITGRLEQIMADITTAQADVAAFVDDVKTHFAGMSAQIADLKAKLAAAPSPDPAVQAAVDKIEASLADGRAVVDAAPAAPAPAPAGPAGATVTAGPDGTATPSPAAPAPEQTVTPPAVADAGHAAPAPVDPAPAAPVAPGSVVTSDGTPPATGGTSAPGSVVAAPASVEAPAPAAAPVADSTPSDTPPAA